MSKDSFSWWQRPAKIGYPEKLDSYELNVREVGSYSSDGYEPDALMRELLEEDAQHSSSRSSESSRTRTRSSKHRTTGGSSNGDPTRAKRTVKWVLFLTFGIIIATFLIIGSVFWALRDEWTSPGPDDPSPTYQRGGGTFSGQDPNEESLRQALSDADMDCSWDTEISSGYPVATIEGAEDPQLTIIYLHGGSYVLGVSSAHCKLCDDLAVQLKARVIIPEYPLAPDHIYEDAYRFLDDLYFWKTFDCETPVIIMGDSAGGGLAAGFCEYLVEENVLKDWSLPAPAGLLLICPWLDITMSGDYGEYGERDTLLDIDSLRHCGEMWAGETNPKDYRLSPLFGDVSILPPTELFVGTDEIFYPDVMSFRDELQEASVPVNVNVGEGRGHDYPVYQSTRGDEVQQQMVEFIESIASQNQPQDEE